MKSIKLFVITHKEIFYKLKDIYIPILVGKNKKNNDLNYITDDTNDNISNKNSNYCELTGIYWLWKNYELPDYIGICHYRRFFVKRPFYNLINQKYIEKILSNYDVILPYPYDTKSSVKQHFIESPSGREKDLDRLERLIKEKYNSYYLDYMEVMNARAISYCNMVIMNKENFIKYCEWLFNILFEFEQTTDLNGYSVQEARIYGFLSEFLLNVWIKHNNLKISYCNVLKVEKNKITNFLKKIKLFLLDINRNIITKEE